MSIKKDGKSYTCKLMEHLKTLHQKAPKRFRQQEIIKLRTEIKKRKKKNKENNTKK